MQSRWRNPATFHLDVLRSRGRYSLGTHPEFLLPRDPVCPEWRRVPLPLPWNLCCLVPPPQLTKLSLRALFCLPFSPAHLPTTLPPALLTWTFSASVPWQPPKLSQLGHSPCGFLFFQGGQNLLCSVSLLPEALPPHPVPPPASHRPPSAFSPPYFAAAGVGETEDVGPKS